MLSLYQVRQIKVLLEESGLSQRDIAEKMGVSRGTVQAIASGRRGLHGRETRWGASETEETPPQRCHGCGQMVYLPCVYCRAEAYAERQRRMMKLACKRMAA